MPPPGPSVPSISLVAGDIGGPGNIDGTAIAARFAEPVGVAADAAGTAYVVDGANRTIRRVSATGQVSLLAGFQTPADAYLRHPQRDGDRSVALFGQLSGIALDPARGVLYVTDYDRVRRVTLDGTVSTLTPLPFVTPLSNQVVAAAIAVAVAPDGTPLVAAGKSGSKFGCCFATALYRLPGAGGAPLLAGDPAESGTVDAQGAAARYSDIASIAIDRAGTVYVADSATLRKVTPDGVVSTLAGSAQPGFADGVGPQARFGRKMGLTVDTDGNVLVSDGENLAIRKVTPQGSVSTLYRDQPLSAFLSSGIAVDAGGRILYTALYGLFSAGNPSRTVAGTGVPSRDALFNAYTSASISVDRQGNILNTNFDGTILTRIGPTGAVIGFAGDGVALQIPKPPGGSFTGSQAIDGADNVYQIHYRTDGPTVAGGGSSILKITPSGEISTSAQSAGEFSGLTADASGSVYFIDQAGPAIRKLTPTGDIGLVAILTGDLGADIARGSAGSSLAVDRTGKTFYIRGGSQRCGIYRVDAAGTTSLFAGQLDQCGIVDGKGGQAQFLAPDQPVVDSAGNVYIADGTTIRRITPDATVTTIAGRPGAEGTTLGPLPGTLAVSGAHSLAIDRADTLYLVAGTALLKINLR
jgi:streptogramin lyase